MLRASANDSDARALPVSELVSLATELAGGTGLTINFGVVQQLGYPLVLLRSSCAVASERFETLTPREREVAACVAGGLRNREIAAKLCLTTATVKDHVHRVLVKSGLPNRAAVAAAWRTAGIHANAGFTHTGVAIETSG